MTYYLHNNGTIRETAECLGEGLYCKPQLVAIVPVDDREQVERLAASYVAVHDYAGKPWAERMESARQFVVDNLSAALRRFADPPRVQEPTLVGAVVEAEDGRLWVRTADIGCSQPWCCVNSYADAEWPSINAVRVLSPGYDPEATS